MEASYRQVGERIRQLPAIVPPPEFRARVFAAIRAEEMRVAPSVARLARATTDPALPALRPVPRQPHQQRVAFNMRFAMAIAAVLVLSLVGARVLPLLVASSLSKSAANLNGAGLNVPSDAHIARYSLTPGYAFASSAIATASWLVYSASDTAHAYMLFADNRQSEKMTRLLAAPSPIALTVRALTNNWVVWSAGDGSSSAVWLLQAERLPESSATASAPVTLVDSRAAGADTPTTLGGVWADGDTVLVAAATAAGGELLRFDLSSRMPVSSVIARSSTPGHLLTDPSADNGLYFWSDVWYDGTTGLHSEVWRGDGMGHAMEVSANDAAFHPQATHGTLVWAEVAPASLAGMKPVSGVAPADDNTLLLNELNGSLMARGLDSGSPWQISQRADVSSIQVGGSLLLWHSDSQTHLYDLRSRSASTLDSELRGATYAAASGSAVVWQSSATSGLYVGDAS